MAVPVTFDDAKAQLQLEFEDASRDIEVANFVLDAAAWVERYTGHILVARDVVEQFSGFGRLDLRAWPVKPDATVAVTFVDGAGAAIVITGARVLARRPATVLPAVNTRWPPVAHGIVTVTVRAGYEAGDVVPGNMRRAMLLLISAYDADREGGDILSKAEAAARRLCADFRLRRL